MSQKHQTSEIKSFRVSKKNLSILNQKSEDNAGI